MLDNQNHFESPFLNAEINPAEAEQDLSPRLARLVDESPFGQLSIEIGVVGEEHRTVEGELLVDQTDVQAEVELADMEDSDESIHDHLDLWADGYTRAENEDFHEDITADNLLMQPDESVSELANKEDTQHPSDEYVPIEEESIFDDETSIKPEEEAPYAGPAIGPIHTGVIPSPMDLRKGVPSTAQLSPLAITLRGLRKAPYAMKKVSQIVIHQTSRGPVNRSKNDGYRKSAVEYALDFYLNGGPSEGFPHYVIDFNGTIYAVCDERYIAHHAGWVHAGKRALFERPDWRAPNWWLAAWSQYGFTSPIDLLPKGARSPNTNSIGIELLITPELSYTEQQYQALARLIADIEQRHGLLIPAAPSPMLLGHEDYAPVPGKGGRVDKNGGWDPGAHRTNPYFSWGKLWSYMRSGLQTASAARPTLNSAPDTNVLAALSGWVGDSVKKGLLTMQAAWAMLSGERDINKLTNLIFYARNPDLPAGHKIQPHEKHLAREWVRIRDEVVKPHLRRLSADGMAKTSQPDIGTSTPT